MFKTSLDNFGNDLGHFCIFELFFDFFENFRRLHRTLGKKIFKKIAPKHVWTLGNVFGHFGTLKLFWFFSSIFFKYLPQKKVRKTELKFLCSGIWTHNFKSRTSEMELRILTVAWMQKECLLSIVSKNWTLIFKSGNLSSYFWVQKTELIILSPENLKSRAWNTGQKKIRINRPKAFSKHVWTLLETIKGIFWILKFFWFFWNFSKTRPSMEHWARMFFFRK